MSRVGRWVAIVLHVDPRDPTQQLILTVFIDTLWKDTRLVNVEEILFRSLYYIYYFICFSTKIFTYRKLMLVEGINIIPRSQFFHTLYVGNVLSVSPCANIAYYYYMYVC